MSNPYEAPQAPAFAGSTSLPEHYGGIGRLAYFGISLALIIMHVVASAVVLSLESMAAGIVALGDLAVLAVVSVVSAYYRLKNIGMNPWWCFLVLVPLINLLVMVRCTICQEGYQVTKKLDTAGKVLTFIVLGFFLLAVGLVILGFVAAGIRS